MNTIIIIKILKIVGVILIILFGIFCFIMCYLLGFTLIPEKDIINTPIPLDKQGYVLERKVKIKEEGSYRFILDFIIKPFNEDKGIDRKKIFKYLRGDRDIKSDREIYLNKAGTPIPIKLTLYRIDQKHKELLLEKEYNTNGLNSWGSIQLIRDIDSIRLNNGWHLIRLETLKDFPELKNRKVFFTVRRYHRNK